MANALGNETSPYLLQHADNPVDWMPWGPEALARAREQHKPILLSIGYSACHWCHVMAHESFEDPATAEVMNRLFVNIKVDREERPDLDRIYQTSQQLFTGRPGGWPLTVFLTPDEQWPFFAGTYFPKEPRYGMPSFRDVLERVEAYFRTHRDEIDTNAGRLLEALGQTAAAEDPEGDTVRPGYLKLARARLGESFDAANGGFGSAPKFPHAAELGFLLTLTARDEGARTMVTMSLRAMIAGGLFDHLGGGFFRYCVDQDWRIPHFEKMLYDNAMLLGLLSESAAVSDDPLERAAAHATADWLTTSMRDPAGGFYATLDADSEGEEGKYYAFTASDLEHALSADERDAARAYFGLDEPPNFEGRSWHLQPRAKLAPHGAADATIERARRKLLELRATRIPPGRDEKILTSWNGLAIGALARTARWLGRDDVGAIAADAADFVHTKLWHDGRLCAVFKDGRARFTGYLDDYAFLAQGLIDLMQWQFRREHLDFAIALADCMLEHFADPDGGFFFTADDHEALIHRPKPLPDESVPSGNGVAALALDTLGHLLGEQRYLDAAAGTVRAALPSIGRYPEAHASLLRAMQRQLEPPELLIVRGEAAGIEAWQRRLASRPSLEGLRFFVPAEIGDLPGLLGERQATSFTRAWLCRGTECLAPIDDLDTLDAALAPPAVPGTPARPAGPADRPADQ